MLCEYTLGYFQTMWMYPYILLGYVDVPLDTVFSAKCHGICWQQDLLAERANRAKVMRGFFVMGELDIFHGKLNPLSSSSIFETSVLLRVCTT